MVRRINDMYKKYEAKYSGTNVTTALTAIKPLMDAMFQAGSSTVYDVVERTRAYLDSVGIPSTLWGPYIAFAQKVAKKTFSFSATTLAIEVSALKREFMNAYGLSSAVLDGIINIVVGGAAAPYY